MYKVMLVGLLVVFSTWLAKTRLAEDRLTGATPVPLSCAVCGEFEAPSVTVSIPVRAPMTVGVNVTAILQVAPAGRVFGAMAQFEVSPKSPEAEMLLMLSGTVCMLLRVKISDVLVVFAGQLPKLKLVGPRVWARAGKAEAKSTASGTRQSRLLKLLLLATKAPLSSATEAQN